VCVCVCVCVCHFYVIYFNLSAAENVCPLLVSIDSKAVYIPKSGPPWDIFAVEERKCLNY